MKTPYDIVLLDLETNGLPPEGGEVRIVEIGAVRLEASTLRELESFSMLVDGRPMTPKATSVTTITDAMLEGRQKFEAAGRVFSDWVWRAGRPFILSSWGVHFDIPCLRSEYRRVGGKFPFPGKTFDAKTAAVHFFWLRGCAVKTCSVERALARLGLSFDGLAHRALDDARNEARILRVVSGLEPGGPTAQVRFGGAAPEKGASVADAPENEEETEG